MNLFQEFAGEFRESDEYLTDVVRKQGGPRCRKSKHLKAMNHGSIMSVPGCPNRIVVHRMIVCRHCLEGRRVCVCERSAGCTENITDLQIFKPLWGHHQKRCRIKRSDGLWLSVELLFAHS